MTKKVITINDVEYTAELARLEMSKKELEKITKDLNGILGYFKDLETADTSNFEKFNHYELLEEKKNHFREDEVVEPGEKEKSLIKDDFPNSSGNFLSVKSILKKK